jgi:hypothetical protein
MGRQGCGGHQVMDMGMGGHVAGPGMSHAEHADVTTEVFRVQGESLQRGSGGLKEQVVHEPLARAGHGSQGFGPGTGDEKIGHGQEQLALRIEPPGGLVVLARGPMAIFAGMGAVLAFLALCALLDMTAHGFGAAGFDGQHGSQGACGHAVAEAGAIVGAMEAEDIGQLDHESPLVAKLSRALMRRSSTSNARVLALPVRWVETEVVVGVLWPRYSCIRRRVMPASSRCVA